VGRLEAGFLELINESRKTVKDCNQLERDFDNAQSELANTFEMIFALFMRFGNNSTTTKKPKESTLLLQDYISEGKPYEKNQEVSLVNNRDPSIPTMEEIGNILANLVSFSKEGFRNAYPYYQAYKPGQPIPMKAAEMTGQSFPAMIEVRLP
jgi:hypothetical protein